MCPTLHQWKDRQTMSVAGLDLSLQYGGAVILSKWPQLVLQPINNAAQKASSQEQNYHKKYKLQSEMQIILW